VRRLAILVVALAAAAPADAAIVNVNCATQSLQARINAASAGDTLRIRGTCSGSFTLIKNLTLDGNPRATIDGLHLGRPLTVVGASTTRLLDLTITGGQVLGGAGGGGIYSAGGSLTLVR
jgi:nitrous oxidase accessory protein NosD